jgi:catechol 2,3-dioxygenase-like lactoylglutathione lyase family enzyme
VDLTIQAVLINVSDLKQSVDFYRDVFDLHVVSQADRVSAVMVNEKDRRQVLLLRELGRNAYHGGRGNIGLRLLTFEVGSLEELEVIEQRFVQRQALVWHATTETYRTIMGLDPDRIEVFVASGLAGTPITSEDWHNIDDAIYAIE